MAGEQQASEKRSRSETLRLWIQAVGIPLAVAGLGVLQFWLIQVKWPSQAPVNVTTELQVKEAGLIGAKTRETNGLEAIELEITALNPSTRKLYLLKNLWVAHGITIKPPAAGNWMKVMEDHLNGDHRIAGGKHYSTRPPVTIAAGNAFTDEALQPNEKVVRTFVFYVPRGAYDYVEVDVFLPTTPNEKPSDPGKPVADVDWKLRADGQSYGAAFYRIKPDGSREDPTGTDISDLGLQVASSTRMLPLWRAPNPVSAPPSSSVGSP